MNHKKDKQILTENLLCSTLQSEKTLQPNRYQHYKRKSGIQVLKNF